MARGLHKPKKSPDVLEVSVENNLRVTIPDCSLHCSCILSVNPV